MTISQFWEHYRKKVLHPNAPPIQISETQIAFYAGASCALKAVYHLGGLDISESEGVQKLQELLDEVEAFRDLMAARAEEQG